MKRETLLNRIKRTIRTFDKRAKVILYGSRARGDFGKDSDWDLLILLTRPANYEQERQLRRKLFHLELETGEVLSTIIDTIAAWNSERNRFSPFSQNVNKEGITL